MPPHVDEKARDYILPQVGCGGRNSKSVWYNHACLLTLYLTLHFKIASTPYSLMKAELIVRTCIYMYNNNAS